MKNISILTFLLIISTSLFSQSFRVPRNVVSTSLFQPFAAIGGYTISFERLIDPGYSLNVAQFSYKFNTTIISYNQKKEYATINSQVFFDKEAYQFFGYTILPELRYYFTWDAPLGVYASIFGSYSNYSEIFSDINNEAASYEKKYSTFGRGIGAGFQFKFFEYYTIDVIGGYHPKSINSKTKSFESEEFIENPLLKEEKLYLNLHLGINF
tara:strand:- start:2184 stop:2816 length:633 start_codon:yes stop_codon:yes gene_type:complete